MDDPTVGRQVFEKDIFYVKVPERDAKALISTCVEKLSDDEQGILEEYIKLMQKKTPFWGGF